MQLTPLAIILWEHRDINTTSSLVLQGISYVVQGVNASQNATVTLTPFYYTRPSIDLFLYPLPSPLSPLFLTAATPCPPSPLPLKSVGGSEECCELP